jgi:CBS domain-containing protein
VADAGQIVGIVSIGDVVKYLMRDQRAHIEHLEEYIQGRA